MPKREDEFWATQNEQKERRSCPRCGNTNISYNQKFQSWRCNRCEHSFNFEDTTLEFAETEDTASSKSKAWFGNEYFDKKTQKWKKPGYKKSSIVISIVVLVVVIIIVLVICLYAFVFSKPVS